MTEIIDPPMVLIEHIQAKIDELENAVDRQRSVVHEAEERLRRAKESYVRLSTDLDDLQRWLENNPPCA